MGLGSSLRRLLFSLPAAGYYSVQKIRANAYAAGLLKGRIAPVAVISVGNIVLGGSGKTPFVIRLAELAGEQGLKPAVVSRGYRGTNREPYLVVGDGTSSAPLVSPEVSGDEPFLIARRLPQIPVLVGRRRIHPVTAAVDLFGCNLVILDDGFQHLPLGRNVDIVLLTGREDSMFPLGRLREPPSALMRSHIAVLVGHGVEPSPATVPYLRRLPLFRCSPVPVALENSKAITRPEDLAGIAVTLVSGIANPDRFRKTAQDLGWNVAGHVAFPDHHYYSDGELRGILENARGNRIVVTEKDWVKLPQWFRETENVSALRIGMVLDQESAFRETVRSFL